MFFTFQEAMCYLYVTMMSRKASVSSTTGSATKMMVAATLLPAELSTPFWSLWTTTKVEM